jgi:hypothetical protein
MIMKDEIEDYWKSGIKSYTKIANLTRIKKNFVKKIVARLNKYGSYIVNRPGPRSKVNKDMLDFAEK